FVVILGFAATIGEEAVNLAQQLPRYEQNIRAKIRAPEGVPGAGILGRATRVIRDLGEELANSATPGTAPGPRNAGAQQEARPPVPVVVREPEATPLQVLEGLVEPLLLPLASAGLVLLFVVMILLRREDLRDRLLRLAGVRDLHRTTAAMNEAAERVSNYLL